MAASLLRVGRLTAVKCLQVHAFRSRAPPAAAATAAAFSSKSGGSKKKKNNSVQLDPIQKLFLEAIRGYSSQSKDTGGLVDAGAEYQKALAEETARLQRLYGGGDLDNFPDFNFPEPKLDDVSQK